MTLDNNNYVFIDESGKPEVYSAKGVNLVEKGQATKFLVLAAVRVNDQLLIQQKVTDFKLQLLKDENLKKIFSSAYTLNSFHAQTDYPEVKEKFYAFINALDVKIDVLVVEKLKCFEQLKRNPGKMYGVMAGQLLKNICHQSDKTEIIFSRKDSKLKLRQELEFEVERVRLGYLQNHQNLKAQFIISYQHSPHYTHSGLQIADYIAYAVFQVYENRNVKWYKIVKNKIGKIQDICNKKYFTRSNPLQLST
ncbi:MAG: DUF3800 domain-containing protein [bacterium]|nr:DUF3800 domain-containing protein [bacterium]